MYPIFKSPTHRIEKKRATEPPRPHFEAESPEDRTKVLAKRVQVDQMLFPPLEVCRKSFCTNVVHDPEWSFEERAIEQSNSSDSSTDRSTFPPTDDELGLNVFD